MEGAEEWNTYNNEWLTSFYSTYIVLYVMDFFFVWLVDFETVRYLVRSTAVHHVVKVDRAGTSFGALMKEVGGGNHSTCSYVRTVGATINLWSKEQYNVQ